MGLKGDSGESISTPKVTVSPATQTVTENQTATFYCSATGNPRPVVTWSKVNESLGEKILSTNDGKHEIPSSSYNDTGKYICTAINVLGQDRKITKLLVEGGPLLFCLIPFKDKQHYCGLLNAKLKTKGQKEKQIKQTPSDNKYFARNRPDEKS